MTRRNSIGPYRKYLLRLCKQIDLSIEAKRRRNKDNPGRVQSLEARIQKKSGWDGESFIVKDKPPSQVLAEASALYSKMHGMANYRPAFQGGDVVRREFEPNYSRNGGVGRR